MKVAVLGGGGFRTPILYDALTASETRVSELVLHDLDPDRLARVDAVITALGRERGGTPFDVRTTTSQEDAVDEADAVLAAIRVGGVHARVIDEEVPLSHGVLGQETVGPGGVAFALRTVPVMRRIAEVVRDRAPTAWFVNFTNPAGIVTEAARGILGDRAIGICDSPAALCARVAASVERPVRSLRFDYAGLNHLGWLLAAEADGVDLLRGSLRDDGRLGRIHETQLFGASRVRALGAIPNEYLVYLERASEVTSAFARSGGRGAIVAEQQRVFYEEPLPDPETALAIWRRTKDARHGTYMAEAPIEAASEAGSEAGPDTADTHPAADGPGELGYAAVAADFLHAVGSEQGRRLILNVANEGRLDGIADGEVVEVSCEIGTGGVRPLPGRPLPPEAAELVARVKEVERLTLRASAEGSAEIALEAIAAHPVVPNRDVAERILTGYLERHTSLRELLR